MNGTRWRWTVPRPDREFLNRYGPCGLVIGAAQGLGQAYAEALARRGLDLLLVDRQEAALARVAAALAHEHGGRADTLVVDLAEPDAADRIVNRAGPETGLVVYNAAESPVGPYLDVSPAVLRRMLAVNCAGPALIARAFGERLRARGRGGLILMSSLSGFQGGPFVAHYAATKAYNLVLAEGLWDEWRAHGVDVLACCPGATLTPGYLGSRSPEPGRFAPPEMRPADVVAEALAALGRTPSVVAGRQNRLGAFVLQRIFSRRRAVTTMGRVGRGLVWTTPGNKEGRP
jgi:hypothetical protein